MPRWVRPLGQAALTIGVLAAIVAAVDLSAVAEAVRRARWPWLCLAVALLPVNVGLDGWVWGRLLGAVDEQLPPGQLARALLCGFTLGFWTPVRVGEFAGRVWSVPGRNRWVLSLSVVAQRMLDMGVGVGVGLLLLGGTLYAGTLPLSTGWLLAAALGAGTVAVLAAAVLVPRRLSALGSALFGETLSLPTQSSFFRRLTPVALLPALGGTVVRYFVFTGQFAGLVWALSAEAPVAPVATAVGLTFYAKYLIPSLTLLDLGIREGGAVFFFSLLGLSPAVGLAASLLLFTLNTLLPAVVGLPTIRGLTVLGSTAEDTAPAGADS